MSLANSTCKHYVCRPHSTDLFTHRKMTMSLADRSNKSQKVKVLPIHGSDPGAHRHEMIKVSRDVITNETGPVV